MKNLLFLLLPIFSFCQFSQNQDSLSINIKSDKFARLAYSDYDKEIYTKFNEYSIYYNDKIDSTIFISFDYFIVKQGENKDLNIAGTNKYNLDAITGRYLELFPIWNEIRKEYGLQPLNEDEKVTLTQKGGEFFDKNNYHITFFKGRDGLWKIEMLKR